MGIHDRDYYRAEGPGTSFWSGSGTVCKRLIAVNVVVYVLQLVTYDSRDPSGGLVTRWLQMNQELLNGQLWRLITYAFCHSPGSPWHILWNMYFLWVIGQELEGIYGSREFLRLYLASAVFSAIIYVALGFAVPHGTRQAITPMLGASGAVAAVLVILAMFFPRRVFLFFLIIPIELRFLVLLNLIFDLHPLLLNLGGGFIHTGVAHAAHLGGMLYGFLYKYYDLRWDRITAGWSWPKFRRAMSPARRSVRLYRPPEQEAAAPTGRLDEQVDAILAKISAHGEASLTDAEREVLKEASRRYKNRN